MENVENGSYYLGKKTVVFVNLIHLLIYLFIHFIHLFIHLLLHHTLTSVVIKRSFVFACVSRLYDMTLCSFRSTFINIQRLLIYTQKNITLSYHLVDHVANPLKEALGSF